jgi:hypothetical protein
MKPNPADHWCSMCVRERAEWKCQRCGKQYVYPDSSMGLDCCHYQTRDEWATRYEPTNLFSLCRGCHGYFDRERRFEFEGFYIVKFGQAKLDNLRGLACDISRSKEIKRTRGKGDIAEHFRNQYKIMLEKRAAGVTGWLDFEEYVP